MSSLQNRIDIAAEMIACERIWGLDEARLDQELRKAGIDTERLTRQIEACLGISVASPGLGAPEPSQQTAGLRHAEHRPPPAAASVPQSTEASVPAMVAAVPALNTFEIAGRVKFFDARRGFGFIVADGDQGDALVLITHLREAGYQTVYEGARIHALVHETPKGLQVSRILSIDESEAVHPSQTPQRTREKVQPESDWVRVYVKWYNATKGYGFVFEHVDGPDYMVHAATLQRWGVAPLWPKQVVEIRWGSGSKGRMVVEIRCPGGLSSLPPVH